MLLSSAAGRVFVERAANAEGLAPARVLVSPGRLDPFRRLVVVEVPGGYRFGALRWLPRPSVSFSTAFAAKNEEDPAAVAASRTPEGKKFLVWARFPYFVVRRERSGALVSLRDARYPSSWASVTIAVPAGLLRSSP